MPRKTHPGRFYVSGDYKDRFFESRHAATSLALSFASQCKDDKAYYIREIGSQGVVVQIERVGKIIITRKVK